jgi:uncharacterized protein YndB with AHSA1/START domain
MIALYIIGAIVFILIIMAMAAPKDLRMERKIVVSVSPETVFNSLKSLKKQDQWSPWHKKDPNMKSEYRGTDGEVGSVSYWKGNKDVGEGEQEIKALTPNDRIDSELRFIAPFKAVNDAYFDIKPSGNGSEVTWGFYAKYKFPISVMMMFMNIEKTLGGEFEQGLRDFKTMIENNA